MEIKLNDIDLLLLPQKTLYIPLYKILCIADWHLGKAAHFRKHGIPLPQPKRDKGFEVFENLIATYHTNTVLFLGDLFHSVKNNEWNVFHSFIQQHHTVDFILVKGNHDIISDEDFQNVGIMVAKELIIEDQLCFTHHPLYERTPKDFLNISGHIHPACVIEQKARQSVRLPCFYYRYGTLLLPAFGEMTGMHVLPYQAQDVVFPIVHDEVIKLQ
ncbi:MAG TPA: ligase-associated DNA damage response endonuclease PdeM [Arachidicoccus sp.]